MSGKKTLPPDVAVVIPSYEPSEYLLVTVRSLVESGAENVVVVNDGSGRKYNFFFERLRDVPSVTVLRHPKNIGRGAAIKTGIKYCLDNIPSCRAIMTVDGDGHHRVKDVVACAHKTIDTKSVILGERESDDPTILRSGHYGNKITSRLISIVCDFDFRISDPLTSLRGIPSKYFENMLEIDGETYDYEMNMILDISRNKIPLKLLQIVGQPYDDGKKKSHFRPVRDTFIVLLKVLKYYDKQFAYAFSSMLCYMFEYVIFRMLLAFAPVMTVIGINYVSRAAAYTLNFAINKKFVFKVDGKSKTRAIKYAASVLIAITLSSLLIASFNRIFPTENNTVAKYIKPLVDTAVFFLNYFMNKNWVFREKD